MIFLTGSNGFIGSNILQSNLFTDIKIISRSDLTSLEKLNNQKTNGDSLLFHFASAITNDQSKKDEEIKILKNILNFCYQNNISLVFPSTSFYESPTKKGSREDGKIFLHNKYSQIKYECELLIKDYVKQNNLNAIILRIFNVYGPGQPSHYFLPNVLKSISNNVDISIFENLKRDYIHVDDLVSLLHKISNSKIEDLSIYNAGSGKNYSNKDILKMVLKNFKNYQKHTLETSSIISPEATLANISKTSKKFGWMPKQNLEYFIENAVKNLTNKSIKNG